jgi:hypothetical protein
MAIALYMDHHVPRAITNELRLRGVDVLTAYEDGMSDAADPVLLQRAAALRRVVFTQDYDFLVEATRRQRAGADFSGVIFAHQLRVSIGASVRDLEILAKATDAEAMLNRVEFLPL